MVETDKVVRAMARWWQTVSQEENDSGAKNPMLYDPLQDGAVRTSKKMQYVAAIIVCLGAVSAGTALGWSSPAMDQLTPEYEKKNKTNSTVSDVVNFNLNATVLTTNSSELMSQKIKNLPQTTKEIPTLPTVPTASIESAIANTTDLPGELKLPVDQRSWVSSLLAIGAFFGAIPSGIIADKIGRKYTAMIMDIPFIVAWICIVFANSAGLLYLGRFLIGISTGSFCVVAPMYISEIAETSIRGTLGTFFQLFLTIGILLVYLIGAFVHWKTLSALCLIMPVTLFIAMFFLPETPTYLLKKGRRGDAALSLKWLWGRYCDSRSAIQVIQSDLDSTSGADASMMDLFTNRACRKGLLIALALMFFQQFSGINAVIFFTNKIFESAGSTLKADYCSIIVGIVQVVMTFVSALLIEQAGRKILLVFSSTIMCICLTILGAFFFMKDHNHDVSSIGWLPLLCVVMFIVTFSIGYGPIPWLMMGELFLPNVKGTAVSLIVMFNWTAVFVVTKSFEALNISLGSSFTFWLFAAFMATASAFVSLVVFETKGRSPAQIQMQLAGERAGATTIS